MLAVRRGICLCENGLSLEFYCHSCNRKSMGGERIWRWDFNGTNKHPIPTESTKHSTMDERTLIRSLQNKQDVARREQQKEWKRMYDMKDDTRQDYLEKYKDAHGNWLSYVILSSKFAKQNKYDFTPEGIPIYLYTNQKNSLVKNNEVKRGMETFSFTMYTFLGTRGRHTNANSMLDNAMLHVDVIDLE